MSIIKICTVFITILALVLFLLLQAPNWIEIYSDSKFIDNGLIENALAESYVYDKVLYLPKLANKLQTIPMVKTFSLKRIWGNGLRIVLETHEVNGYLAAKGLIVSGNKIVQTPYDPSLGLLVFDGELEDFDVMQAWYNANKALLKKVPGQVLELGYDHVSSQWRILWDNSLVLLLGHTNIASFNLGRWLKLLPYFAKHRIYLSGHIFDLRYPDGFAYAKLI